MYRLDPVDDNGRPCGATTAAFTEVIEVDDHPAPSPPPKTQGDGTVGALQAMAHSIAQSLEVMVKTQAERDRYNAERDKALSEVLTALGRTVTGPFEELRHLRLGIREEAAILTRRQQESLAQAQQLVSSIGPIPVEPSVMDVGMGARANENPMNGLVAALSSLTMQLVPLAQAFVLTKMGLTPEQMGAVMQTRGPVAPAPPPVVAVPKPAEVIPQELAAAVAELTPDEAAKVKASVPLLDEAARSALLGHLAGKPVKEQAQFIRDLLQRHAAPSTNGVHTNGTNGTNANGARPQAGM
jgi:hypothetical protein